MRIAVFIVFLVAVLAFGGELRAQGTVVFHNLKPTAVISNALTDARIPPGAAFKAGLYYAPDAVAPPPDSAFTQIGAAVDFGPAPGHFDGGQRIIPPPAAPGAPGYFQVRVWETAYGATYEEAITAPPMNGRPSLRGTSNKVRVPATGHPTGQPPSLPPAIGWFGLQGFSVSYPGLSP